MLTPKGRKEHMAKSAIQTKVSKWSMHEDEDVELIAEGAVGYCSGGAVS